MRVFYLVTILMIVTLAMPAVASDRKNSAKSPQASSKSIFVAKSGEVILTFLSKSATYSSDLFLAGSHGSILNNQTAVSGQKFSLGSFQADTELVFKIFVNNTGHTFFNGVAANNPDNMLHAVYSRRAGKPLIVGFEDLYGGGDRDFNDLIFSISNVYICATPIVAVPEPETYALLLAGVFTIGALKRRKAAR